MLAHLVHVDREPGAMLSRICRQTSNRPAGPPSNTGDFRTRVQAGTPAPDGCDLSTVREVDRKQDWSDVRSPRRYAALGADGNGDDEAPRHSDEQIAYELRQAESSTTVTGISRQDLNRMTSARHSGPLGLGLPWRSESPWRHVRTRSLIIDRGDVPTILIGRSACSLTAGVCAFRDLC
jgi:hypothetical protein